MRPRYRTLFWPVVLIMVGIAALLVDLNVISADRLYRLADLWPLVLIVIGLELIARRALKGTTADLAAALILLIAGVGAVGYISLGPAIPAGTHQFDSSGAIGNLASATLHVDVGAATVTVSGSSSLGSDLYHARIQYSGIKPSVTFDSSTGDLHISQEGPFLIFGSRRVVVELQINPVAKWSFSVNTGAADETLDLTGVGVGSVELNTGASHDDITLGPPSGMVPITINGGALTVNVHRLKGTEASIQVSGGAVSLSADGEQTRGIGSKSWQSAGFDAATDAYTIDVNGGACTVTLDTRTAA